jgi:hypothetical protein
MHDVHIGVCNLKKLYPIHTFGYMQNMYVLRRGAKNACQKSR